MSSERNTCGRLFIRNSGLVLHSVVVVIFVSLVRVNAAVFSLDAGELHRCKCVQGWGEGSDVIPRTMRLGQQVL